MMACRTIPLLIACLLLPSEIRAIESSEIYRGVSGPVISVLDGDTIEVLNSQRPERIRLSGIDCPENGQAYGKKAKQAASALAFGKDVTVQTHGLDKYKRILGDVILPDGMNLNHELVKQGWCWWYRKYAPGDTVLEGLEQDARDAKKGLWVDPAPIPPWVYRKARRGQALDLSDLVPLDEAERSPLSRRPPISPLLGAVEKDSGSSPATSPLSGHRQPEKSDLSPARLSELQPDCAKEPNSV